MAACAVEGTANDVVYIYGSILFSGFGIVKDAIKLTIEDSRFIAIEGDERVNVLKKILADDDDLNTYMIGEIGFGLNPGCTLSGFMLEDEYCGDNRSFSGHTACKFHLGMGFRSPTMIVDGITILDEGKVACC